MRRLILPVTCIMIMLLAACEKYIIYPPEIEEGVSYSDQIQPIFDAKCDGCHSGSRAPDLRAEYSYDELINGGYVNTDDPESSEIYTKTSSGHGGSTQEESLTILTWIEEGALNN